jgi:hypothetical protein
MQRLENKEKILKAAREKHQLTYQGKSAESPQTSQHKLKSQDSTG